MCGRCHSYLEVHKEHYRVTKEPLVVTAARGKAGQGKVPPRKTRSRNKPGEDVEEPIYDADTNGCRHDDPAFWQPSSSGQYFNSAWRQNNPDSHPAPYCIDCGEVV